MEETDSVAVEVGTSHPHKKRKIANDSTDLDDKEITNLEDEKVSNESMEDPQGNSCAEETKNPLHLRPNSGTNSHDGIRVENEENIDNNESKLRECDVGITEYINNFAGISGILKQRYSDFVVRERDLSGSLVQFVENNIDMINAANSNEKQTAKEDAIKEDVCPLNDEDMSKISQFVTDKVNDDCKNASLTLSIDNEKEHRTLVHQFIRKKYDTLDTEVIEVDDGNKAIQIFFKNKSNKRRQNRSKTHNKPKFCYFVLYKENRDTMSAINKIAEILHVRPSIFSYAGTKDKRAITFQQVCASRIEAEKLLSINKRIKSISIGSLTYKDSPLKLGDLSGNHFSIILRDIPFGTDREEIKKIMNNLSEVGFINYFGMQRFGSGSVPTYAIGKAVLQSNWNQTINLILTPREGEEKTFFQAKRHWLENRDSKEALKILNRRRCIEGQVLESLAKLGENAYYNAFQNIPRNTRLLYLHSYQSYVWNRVVSERISKFGLKVLAGDLVVLDNETNTKSKESKQSLTRCKVKHITQAEADNDAYSLTDIVMPLPGYDMIYPENALKDLYTTIIANDGLSLNDMKHNIKDYSLSGAYRYVIVKPENVEWRVVHYEDYCVPLIQTEIDVNQGCQPPELDAAGEHAALKVEFTLPPSSYATMVIREITKLDSSANQQSKLNKKS